MTSARSAFGARLCAGSAAAACALALGTLAAAPGAGSPPGGGAAALLAAPRSPGLSTAISGTGIRLDSAAESQGSGGSGPGHGHAGSPPGQAGAGAGHAPSAPGQGARGRRDHGEGRGAAPPPGRGIERAITTTPSSAPTPVAAPSPAGVLPGAEPRLAAGSGAPSAGTGSTPARRVAAATSPPRSARARSQGAGANAVAGLVAPFVASLPPLNLLPMVSGLRLGEAPQIAIFLLLGNAILAAAIVLAWRRGDRLTRGSLEGGAGPTAAGGGVENLEEWPSAS